MKKLFTFMLIITLGVTACTKQTSFDLNRSAYDKTDTTDMRADLSSAGSVTSHAKTSINGSWLEYRIATSYENNYAHWCQLWASPLSSYEKQNACGPAAYMIAAHMIAAAHGYSFMPASGEKLKAIINKMQYVPISMNMISQHVTNYDSPPLTTLSYTTTHKNSFKTFLESNLGEGNPIIVPIRINTSASVNHSRYLSENNFINYDLDITSLYGRPNYINTSGVGHFVVLIGVKMSLNSCDALVYYKDPLAQSGETRICSYDRFLASAAANGLSNLYYDAIVVRKQ